MASTSILTSIKSLLGIQEDDINFDDDIALHINSVFSILKQLGVNPDISFSIEDKLQTWEEYILTNLDLNAIKSYMYLKVKLLFDPPLSNAMIEIVKTQIGELEWRIMVSVDPIPIATPIVEEELYYGY